MNGTDHYREAERILRAAGIADPESALVMAQRATAHATLALTAATVEHASIAALAADINSADLDAWHPVTNGQQQTNPQLETAPAVASIYRATWGMTPLGTYTNATAAQAHCEADAVNHDDEPEGATYEWFGDAHELDDPADLLVTKNGAQTTTDYTVTRIEVAAEYDAEADA
ncbi:hypothetical protein AB0I93_14445 [Streptomyces sp. NPDC049967]|uniref:hypothetical protein n=1 Tax=Streptomyces sp. NPDC049967 TaxID=3155658 RepID=UPI00344A6F62